MKKKWLEFLSFKVPAQRGPKQGLHSQENMLMFLRKIFEHVAVVHHTLKARYLKISFQKKIPQNPFL